MNDVTKRELIIIFVLVYVFSPIDFMTGIPIDDIIVIILGYVIQKRIADKSSRQLVEG
ncbi:MAG: hypothetical protein GX323_01995 [Clostridiales bacterium]|mgnify:CR=1 FL=1|nr:hypothetical protein [Clostridiales bacterium]